MSWKTFPVVAVLLTALLIGGCASPPAEPSYVAPKLPPPPTTLPANGVVDRGLVADYYVGDGLGYNLIMSLRADGTFTCNWSGCLGDYGNARGVWSRSGDRVSFVSREATGMLENYLRGAAVVDEGQFPALVLDQDHDLWQKYEKSGFLRSWALQRKSTLPR